MPRYAILGATGATGQALLKLLLQSSQNEINVYIRNAKKLKALFPAITSSPQVHIFEGSIQDVDLIRSCLDRTNAVFSVTGTNENVPGLRIAQESAHAIVAALTKMKIENPSASVPRVMFLSSASLNPKLHGSTPVVMHKILTMAFSHVYADVTLATEYLQLHKSWLDVAIIQPGALTVGDPHGHKIRLESGQSDPPCMTYGDLAGGMIEVADSNAYSWMGVGIVPIHGAKFESSIPGRVFRGLLFHFAPPTYWVAQYVGLI